MQETKRLFDSLNQIESLSTELAKLKEEIAKVKSAPAIPVLVSEKQISAELNICTKTLRKYRTMSILPFRRLGKRILYERSEILQRLNEVNRTDSSIRIKSKMARRNVSDISAKSLNDLPR